METRLNQLWKALVGVFAGGLLAFAAEDCRAQASSACLDLLTTAKQPKVSGDVRLGRVRWKDKIMEPVLIRTVDGAKHSFRNCSVRQPAEVPIAEVEIFNSALVARFDDPVTGMLERHREIPFVGYESEGKTKLTFQGTGSMVEARRLGAGHIEVTGTAAAEISYLENIAVLLITSRKTMRALEPEIWDQTWGQREEDFSIVREIIWWELTGSGKLRVHSPVDSFKRLEDLAAGPDVGAQTGWEAVLEEHLQPLLDQSVFSLLVAEQPTHVQLAEKMLELANQTTSDSEFDVGIRQEDWNKDDRSLLEQAAIRGRYWPFTEPYGLAAIMPERIAGKIRRNYHQRPSSADAVDAGLATGYVKLAINSSATRPSAFRIANAVYQDQAAGLAKTMSFLSCLLEDNRAVSRFEVLEMGLERLGVASEGVDEMDVSRAFQHLCQGFSLPVGLSVRESNFLRSLNSGDPKVLSLSRSLESYFKVSANETEDPCNIVLIPDEVLLSDRPVEPVIVSSTPKDVMADSTTDLPPESSSGGIWKEAQRIKAEAREALKGAIYANGWEHTRGKIKSGHKQLALGDALLIKSNGEDRGAISKFEGAKKNFLAAKDKAFRIEHSKPKLRVH